jgi:hypothetical protein
MKYIVRQAYEAKSDEYYELPIEADSPEEALSFAEKIPLEEWEMFDGESQDRIDTPYAIDVYEEEGTKPVLSKNPVKEVNYKEIFEAIKAKVIKNLVEEKEFSPSGPTCSAVREATHFRNLEHFYEGPSFFKLLVDEVLKHGND